MSNVSWPDADLASDWSQLISIHIPAAPCQVSSCSPVSRTHPDACMYTPAQYSWSLTSFLHWSPHFGLLHYQAVGPLATMPHCLSPVQISRVSAIMCKRTAMVPLLENRETLPRWLGVSACQPEHWGWHVVRHALTWVKVGIWNPTRPWRSHGQATVV